MRLNAYRYYMLALLTVISTFNFTDRYALGLVINNIKADLGLSDSQLGLLTGIAFALFYSVMGIPIARWADKGNRVAIIALTAALWSVMVAMCGLAATFAQLMLIRVGVAVGEAGCNPPATSLIADHFSRRERPQASAIYWQSANFSLIIAYFAAGWLNQFYGWRIMFLLIGLPGFVLAMLAWFTIREPRRRLGATTRILSDKDSAPPGESGTPIEQPSLRQVYVTLWANRSFRHLLFSFSVFYFFSYGIMQWQPAFFVRSFGLNTGELGTWFAVVYGVTGAVGMHVGGVWVSRYAPHNERLQLRAMSIANAGFNSIIWALIYFSHNYYVAFVLMGLSSLGGTTVVGPMYAMTQTLVPAPVRATAIAIIFLFANLIGMGLGPLAVGVVSDVLEPMWGKESLRYALLCFSPGFLWVSWHLWVASNTVARDLAALPLDQNGSDGDVSFVAKDSNALLRSNQKLSAE